MNQAWQDFLSRQHAHWQDGVVLDFGNSQSELAAAKNGAVLCDLGQFGTLRVSGEEAQTFLQNMLSSDVREVSQQHAQFSSLNSPKGRVLATFLIWQSGTEYFLQLPRSLSGAIHKKLSMYVLRAKVKIEDVSSQQVSIGLSGNNASALLQENVFEQIQRDPLAVTQGAHQGSNQAHISIIHVGAERFQLNTTPQFASGLWQQFSEDARPAGSPCWDWLNIQAGIPFIQPATQEHFVAQMANLDLIGGISFKKGCYPGQEIVARTQYLGKLKRRMYLAHIDSDTVPQPGDELYSTDMEGQPSGMVVNAAPAPGGGSDLLAVVQISSRETQTVHLKSLQGAALSFLPLPYAIT